jgi:hypothetical protein
VVWCFKRRAAILHGSAGFSTAPLGLSRRLWLVAMIVATASFFLV